MLQSSSPSYPIMASLDASRRLLATEGTRWIERSLQAVREAEKGIEQLAGFETYRRSRANKRPFVDQDPYKLILRDATGALGGFALQRELERRGIFPEMADDRYVLLVFSIASDMSDAERLLGALADISQCFRLSERYEDEKLRNREREIEQTRRELLHSVFAADVSEPVSFGMGLLWNMHQEEAELGHAAGQKAAEMVVPYPPGIPVLYPGETIAPETAEYLRRLALSGARFQGAADPALRTIRVLPETDSAK
jgi:arginine/lysine/ornithine decarboxylase